MTRPALLSIVLPVTAEVPSVEAGFAAYKTALAPLARRLEFIYVLDGQHPQTLEALRRLARAGEPLQMLAFPQSLGESAALSVGFREAAGDIVLTLPPRPEVVPAELPQLVAGLDEADLVVARRNDGRGVPPAPRGRFDSFVRMLFGTDLGDVRSGTRAMRREVAKELTVYGNQFRFLPLLAQAEGFLVRELVMQVPADRPPPGSGLRIDLSLDVLSTFFLLRFIKKPFRFFGGAGFAVLVPGLLLTAVMVIQRAFFGVGLVNRPLLVLSTLLIVLGVQIIAVGLIGEIIAFTYARDIKDYRVDRIVEGPLPTGEDKAAEASTAEA